MKKFKVEMRDGEILYVHADLLVLLDGGLNFINRDSGGSLGEPFKLIAAGRWDLATDITDQPESEDKCQH